MISMALFALSVEDHQGGVAIEPASALWAGGHLKKLYSITLR
jgi:hypothetical protein